MPQSILNVSQNQAQKEVTINNNFNMLAYAALNGWRNPTNTSGMSYQYWGGYTYLADGTTQTLADGTATLTASTNNFIEKVYSTGAIQRVSSFTAGNIPLCTSLAGASSYAAPTDYRMLMLKRQGKSFHNNTQATITTNGVYTTAHGIVYADIGELDIEVRLYCKTAEAGYAVNDEVALNTNNASIVLNATNAIIQLAANVQIISRSAPGTAVNITFANWGIKIYVRRVAHS